MTACEIQTSMESSQGSDCGEEVTDTFPFLSYIQHKTTHPHTNIENNNNTNSRKGPKTWRRNNVLDNSECLCKRFRPWKIPEAHLTEEEKQLKIMGCQL